MKRLLFIFALTAVTMTAGAQTYELNEQGAYEKVTVVHVDSTVTAAVLFDRAMTALSDWAGPDGKSRVNVDYQNQETHTIIYKGRYSLGFKNVFLGAGWNRYADFTLKVRCKDGRAQVTVNVPTMTAIHNSQHIEQQFTVREVVDALANSSGKRQTRIKQLMEDMINTADGIIKAMAERLKNKASDDDF